MDDEEFFPAEYDLTDTLETQIEPLLKTVANLCEEYGIPFTAMIQYGQTEDTEQISTYAYNPPERYSIIIGHICKFMDGELSDDDLDILEE